MAWTNTGGGDHAGADWIISSNTTIAGRHYNIGTFRVNSGVTATVASYSGSNHTSDSAATNHTADPGSLQGALRIEANVIDIQGTIVADGAGYGGGGGGGGGGAAGRNAGFNWSGGSGGSGSRGALVLITQTILKIFPEAQVGLEEKVVVLIRALVEMAVVLVFRLM